MIMVLRGEAFFRWVDDGGVIASDDYFHLIELEEKVWFPEQEKLAAALRASRQKVSPPGEKSGSEPVPPGALPDHNQKKEF